MSLQANETNHVVRPDQTTAEIVIKIGSRASILLDIDDRNDGPPCLCIQGGSVQLLLYPHGWYEFGHVTQDDLDRLSDLVIDATRMRDAVLRRLRQQVALEVEGTAS